jgi:cytidylate kinase
VDFNEILKNVEERDYIDSHRELNPLRQADDALVLDNSTLTREEQSQWLLDAFKRASL